MVSSQSPKCEETKGQGSSVREQTVSWILKSGNQMACPGAICHGTKVGMMWGRVGTDHTVPTLIWIYATENLVCFCWSRCNSIQICTLSGFWSRYRICYQKPDISQCICSSRDRLGFYAEIQIILGTVYREHEWVSEFSVCVNGCQ